MLRVEKRALDLVRIAFDPLISSEARARWAAQPAADGLLLFGEVSDGPFDKIVVVREPGNSRCSRSAFGGLQDAVLGIRDAVTFGVYPGEGVRARGCLEVDEHALVAIFLRLKLPGGVDDVRHIRNRLLEGRICINGVLPDLVGVGRQVDLRILLAVEEAGFLVIEVRDCLVVLVVVEERLVGPDHLGILAEPVQNLGP